MGAKATLGSNAPPSSRYDLSRVRMFREFTPSWFTACMGTGAVSLAIANFPWPFPGRNEIGMAIWALNIIVFCFFSILFLGRLLFFRDTIGPLMRHRSEPLFLGAVPMAFAVITNGFIVFVGPRIAPTTMLATAGALWFANLPMTVFTSMLFPFYIISAHDNTPESMTALWLLPIVAANVAAGSAHLVAAAHSHIPAELSQPYNELVGTITFLGFMLWSYGMFLTVTICTIYWQRLMVHRLPPAAQLISSFLPVGAVSMVAFGIINLGELALYNAPHADPRLEQMQSLLHASAPVLGLLFFSYALWWLVVAAASVIDNLRALPFNLGWWGSVFPTGTMAVVASKLAAIFNLDALRALSALFAAVDVILWLLVAGMTLRRGYRGQLFYAPCLHTYNAAVAAAAGSAKAAAAAGGTGKGAGALDMEPGAGGGDDGDEALGGAVARAASAHLCVDPGLSGLSGAAESALARAAARGGGRGGGGAGAGGEASQRL